MASLYYKASSTLSCVLELWFKHAEICCRTVFEHNSPRPTCVCIMCKVKHWFQMLTTVELDCSQWYVASCLLLYLTLVSIASVKALFQTPLCKFVHLSSYKRMIGMKRDTKVFQSRFKVLFADWATSILERLSVQNWNVVSGNNT